ncbi:hypothetical protein J4E91_008831 [Alternaria rosae]|nr:hypothetical protein J4E91_008831 [Alternaria rosae]
MCQTVELSCPFKHHTEVITYCAQRSPTGECANSQIVEKSWVAHQCPECRIQFGKPIRTAEELYRGQTDTNKEKDAMTMYRRVKKAYLSRAQELAQGPEITPALSDNDRQLFIDYYVVRAAEERAALRYAWEQNKGDLQTPPHGNIKRLNAEVVEDFSRLGAAAVAGIVKASIHMAKFGSYGYIVDEKGKVVPVESSGNLMRPTAVPQSAAQSSSSAGAQRSMPPGLPAARASAAKNPAQQSSFSAGAQRNIPSSLPSVSQANPSTVPLTRDLSKAETTKVNDIRWQEKNVSKKIADQVENVWNSKAEKDRFPGVYSEGMVKVYIPRLIKAGGGSAKRMTVDEKDKALADIIETFGPKKLPVDFRPFLKGRGFAKGSLAEKAYLDGRRSETPVQSSQAQGEVGSHSSRRHEHRAQTSAPQGGRAVEHSPRRGAQAQQPHIQDGHPEDLWQPDSDDELYHNPEEPPGTGRHGRTPATAYRDPGAPGPTGPAGSTPRSVNSLQSDGTRAPVGARGTSGGPDRHDHSRAASRSGSEGYWNPGAPGYTGISSPTSSDLRQSPRIAGQSPVECDVDRRGRSQAASEVRFPASSRDRWHTNEPSASPPAVARHIYSNKGNSPFDRAPSPMPLTPNTQYMEDKIEKEAEKRGEKYKDLESWGKSLMGQSGNPSDQGHTSGGRAPLVPQNLAAGRIHSRPSTSGSNQSSGGGAFASQTNTPAPGTTQHSGSMPKPLTKKSTADMRAAGSPGQSFGGSSLGQEVNSPQPSVGAVHQRSSSIAMRPSASPAASTPAVTTPLVRQATPPLQQARPTNTPGPTGAPHNTTPHRDPAPRTVAPATGAGRSQVTGGAPHGAGNQGPANKPAKGPAKKPAVKKKP